ncbi:MAG: hypothetical protein ACR2JM_00525, partial [Mycobacterium sp.]
MFNADATPGALKRSIRVGTAAPATFAAQVALAPILAVGGIFTGLNLNWLAAVVVDGLGDYYYNGDVTGDVGDLFATANSAGISQLVVNALTQQLGNAGLT